MNYMNRLLNNLLMIICAGVVTLQAYEGFSSSGYARTAAAYLAMPCHAHSAALGTAVTAWRQGVAGAQFNPAILEGTDGYYLIASYSFLGDDRAFIAADGIAPLGSYAVLGVSFVNAGVDKIERRDAFGLLDPNNPYFADYENAVGAAVAGRIPWNIALGARVRYLNQKLDDKLANGFGFDGGATWEPDSHICVGASILNIGSWLWWPSGQRDVVLPQGRLGVACLLLDRQLIIELDGAKTDYQPIEASLGIQYTIAQIVSVRLGASSSASYSDWSSRYPDISTGVGIRYSFFGFDYSITMPTADLGLTMHKVSLLLKGPW
jgi:hypothetical protein